MEEPSFGAQTLERFLDRLASDEPAPGGGAAAAVAAALAAGLASMVARLSTAQLGDAEGVATTADGLRRQALVLADDDAEAYGQVLAAYRLPAGTDPEGRRHRIRAALAAATAVPLEVARVAADAAGLAARLMESGNPNVEGDAAVAILLARSAARSAARLVELNVAQGNLDGGWCEQAAVHVARAGGDGAPAG